ncbi:ABC transporter ATP-binding protein [Salinirubrum litoreum]|uniref:ABC transporter ATP-binding protein n=1 Tax=Salinirubrum litoreum TaxID=1126234 RepID=A0ABD5RDW8_9EURY|nr:ABC transporter ATP-binding protein [Salinirubrum litoreum]
MPLEIDDVTVRYGDVTALNGVSLSVADGETLGLVGTNGAGKTTLFRLLVGHESPDAGSVQVAGHDPTAGPAVREAVGYLPEASGFRAALTGREVLRFHARLRGVPESARRERVARTLATVGLADAADRPVGDYSNGMARRLGLATALVADPDVLLLDEPTAGLDPNGVTAFDRLVGALAERTDTTVVVCSHVLSVVERLCDRVAVLEDGVVRERGSVADLRRSVGSDGAPAADDTSAGTTLDDVFRDAVHAEPPVSLGGESA